MKELKGSPKEGLIAATLGFFVGFAAVSLFGPTANKIKEVIQLSPILIGLLVAMPSLSGSILRIPFSAWVDTNGGRKPFLILLLLSIIGMLGLFLLIYFLYPEKLTFSYYPLLLLLGILCGCGIATFSVGISQVSYWFPQKKQGQALGTYAGIGNIAPGLFSLLIPVALKIWGLAGAYFAWLIFLIFGTILYFIFGKNAYYFQLLQQGIERNQARKIATEKGQEIFPTGSLIESLKISATTWKNWVLVIMYFTSFGGFIALTAWLPTYWKSFYEVSIIYAGILTATYSLLASIIRVYGGIISDKIGGEKTSILALSIMLLGSSFMSFSHNYILSIIMQIIMAIGMGINNAAVFKLVPKEIPQAIGGAAGWVGGLGAFGGFVIPPIMGYFVSAFGKMGFAYGFIVFIFLSILSIFLVAVLLKNPHQK